MAEQRLYDVPGVAEYLDLNISSVRGLLARGELQPVVRIGKRVMVEEVTLRRFIAARRSPQPTAQAIQCVGCRKEVATMKKFGDDLINVTVPCACGASGSVMVTASAAEQP